MGKVYVEVSDLLEHLLLGKPLNGITRVILQSLAGFVNAYGPNAVRLLAYDSLAGVMREKPANLLAALYRQPSGGSLFAEHPLGAALIVQFWAKAAPQVNDTLFHVGNWWWRPPALQTFVKLKAACGAKAVFFIHDLIPIMRPKFVAANHVESFKIGFVHVANCADLLVTSSKAAQSDITKYLAANGLAEKKVIQVPLAHEFQVMAELGFHPFHALINAREKSRQRKSYSNLLKSLNQSSFALMVGTIENRKNVPAVLKTWSELASKFGNAMPKLVLVGKWGQGAHEMKAFLKSTNYCDGRVLVLNNATDNQLAELYKSCAFTIFVSLSEGWGLPLGESLWFRKNVIVLNGNFTSEENLETVALVDKAVDLPQAAVAKALSATSYKAAAQTHLRTVDDFAKVLIQAVSKIQT